MKMIMLKTGILIGGLGMMGYMYLNKHPETVIKVKKTIRDTSKMVYDKMNENMII